MAISNFIYSNLAQNRFLHGIILPFSFLLNSFIFPKTCSPVNWLSRAILHHSCLKSNPNFGFQILHAKWFEKSNQIFSHGFFQIQVHYLWVLCVGKQKNIIIPLLWTMFSIANSGFCLIHLSQDLGGEDPALTESALTGLSPNKNRNQP